MHYLELAIEWYQKAAELDVRGGPEAEGCPVAQHTARQVISDSQFLLALCYFNGAGTPVDVPKALEWGRRACADPSASDEKVLDWMGINPVAEDNGGQQSDYSETVDYESSSGDEAKPPPPPPRTASEDGPNGLFGDSSHRGARSPSIQDSEEVVQTPSPPQPYGGESKGIKKGVGKALDGEKESGLKGALSKVMLMDECAHCGTLQTAGQSSFKRCSRCKLVR